MGISEKKNKRYTMVWCGVVWCGVVSIFLGDENKVFVIQVEHSMGQVIEMFLKEEEKERPMTHDLMLNVFRVFGVKVERAVITDLKSTTYYARLVLKQENSLGQNIADIDARPSDCLALAVAQKRPIFVSRELFEQVDDMSEVLRQFNKGTQADEDAEDDED